jgi:hypothetical protein
MNPLQEKLFDIQIDELLLLAYIIGIAYLQSSLLYLQRAEDHGMLARGSENAFLLHPTSGDPRHQRLVVVFTPLI